MRKWERFDKNPDSRDDVPPLAFPTSGVRIGVLARPLNVIHLRPTCML